MPSIIITEDGQERRVSLDRDEFVVGRHYKADVRLKDAKASRQHFRIVRAGAGWKLVDCGSHNGTFVNGAAVRNHELRAGDRIQVGLSVIAFDDASGSAPAPAPAPAVTVRPPAVEAAAPEPVAAVAAVATATAERPAKPASMKTTATAARPRASERYVVAAAKKGVSPLAVVIGLCAALLAGITLYEYSRKPAVDLAVVQAKVEALRSEGARLEDEYTFDEAIAKFDEAAQAARSQKELDSLARELDARGRNAADLKARHAAACDEWDKIRINASRAQAGGPDVPGLLKRANDLMERVKNSKIAWVKELAVVVKELQGRLEKPPMDLFFECRQELAARLRTDKMDEGHFGPAIAWWKSEFLPKVKDADVRTKVGEEIARLNNVAKEAAHRAIVAAESKSRGDGPGHAAAWLEKAVKRFEGSDSEEAIREAIKKYK